MKRSGLFLVTFVSVLAALPAWAQDVGGSGGPGPMYGHGYMWRDHFYHGGMIFGPFLGLLALIGFVALIIWLVRAFSWRYYHNWHGHGMCPHCGHGRGRAALDILEERYARGEIDKGEFEEKRRLLGR